MKSNLKADATRQGGFSLVELLAVVGIIAILMALGATVVGSQGSSGEINKITRELSLFLEANRVHAMAKNTYVWVGIHADKAPDEIFVAAVEGVTGSASDLNTPSNLRSVQKPRVYRNVSLKKDITGLAGMAANTVSDVSASKLKSFQARKDGTDLTFSQVIQFSPSGEVTVDATPPSRWIQLGFQPDRGGKKDGNNIVALQIAALTGQVRVFRP